MEPVVTALNGDRRAGSSVTGPDRHHAISEQIDVLVLMGLNP